MAPTDIVRFREIMWCLSDDLPRAIALSKMKAA
jgi:hypothetical protein